MSNKRFEFSTTFRDEDYLAGLTDQARTTRELVLAMSSICEFLDFEGEEGGMFSNYRLPTLDTEIWVDERTSKIAYSFFEKPTCPNKVVQKETALSDSSIRATLVQETVRRLKHCSSEVTLEEKHMILSQFAQKMRNSGHTVPSIQYMLVHGVTKYNELVRLSQLPNDHPDYKPLHSSRRFNFHNRKLHKILQKSGWYSGSEVVAKPSWRMKITKGWSGGKPFQHSAPGMEYTSIMHVPSSKDSRLLKMLAKSEPRLAKVTGYQVKYVEMSGRQLSKYFQKERSENRCFRIDCGVCVNSDTKKPSLCQVKGVVYTAVCVQCDKKFKEDMSVAIVGSMSVKRLEPLVKGLASTEQGTAGWSPAILCLNTGRIPTVTRPPPQSLSFQ